MEHISGSALKEVVDALPLGACVIDVRTKEEYDEAHIEGVRNIPLDTLEHAIDELRAYTAVYVQCRSGRRSEAAINMLEAAGLNATLINVDGGILAWEEAGHPVVRKEALLQ